MLRTSTRNAGFRRGPAHGDERARLTAATRAGVVLLPGLWVAAVLGWELSHPGGGQLTPLLAAAPAIACAGTGRRECVLLAGGCALVALIPLGSASGQAGTGARCVTCAAILAVVVAGYLTAGRRARLIRELTRTREIAESAQHALLRPLPPHVGGLRVAAEHLSASEGAEIGGDLYEAVATRHGVRLVIGDVRGHGLDAIATVAAMLGTFRDAAHEEPELPGVLRRLDRALQRHLAERVQAAAGTAGPAGPLSEEFVTLLLAEISPYGEITALNCGHPWPYRFTRPAVRPVAADDPLPPLGLFPLPPELLLVRCGALAPGEGLLFYTDGVADARDASGAFFPFRDALTACLAGENAAPGGGPNAPAPAALVRSVRDRLVRHAGGRFTDDAALLALTYEDIPARPTRPLTRHHTPCEPAVPTLK